jgi:hypothetical protein
MLNVFSPQGLSMRKAQIHGFTLTSDVKIKDRECVPRIYLKYEHINNNLVLQYQHNSMINIEAVFKQFP